MRAHIVGACALAVGALGCAAAPLSRVMIVESVPVETDLGFEDTPDAHEVWPWLIASATRSLDWGAFYVSDEAPSRLGASLRALEEAAARGVTVRVLADAGFYETYPAHLDALDASGIDVRLVEFEDGGAMHAKYFIIDDASAFVGSQNTDWRALEHIYELGMWTDDDDAVRALVRAFDDDWDLGTDLGDPSPESSARGGTRADPPPLPSHWPTWTIPGDDVIAVVSPEARRPPNGKWDLDEILRLLASATETARLSLLSFGTGRRGGEDWTVLYDALTSAGERGVGVRILLADWGKRPSSVGTIQSLQRAPGVDVRFVTIPEASGGFIPYARVSHAKYLVIDDRETWLGTSNWSYGYFHAGRNLGLIVRDPATARAVGRSFDAVWTSAYAEPVDPDAVYTPPRIGE